MNLTVGTTPIAVIDSTRINAQMVISNATGIAVYLGPPNVTVGSGLLLPPGDRITINSPVPLYAVAGASAAGLNVLALPGIIGANSALSAGGGSASVNSPVQSWYEGGYYPAGTIVAHNGGQYTSRTDHTATNLGDEPGVEGTEAEWIAYWKPLSLIETEYGPAYLTQTGQFVFPSCSLGSIIAPMTTTQWTAATVSTTGAPNLNNTAEDGLRISITSTGAQAALLRQYAAMMFNRNWLPGKNSEIDWTKPFRIRIPLRCEIGGTGSGFKYTLFFGGLSAAPSAHTMSGKGLNLCIIGTGAGAGTVQIGAHNGTTQTNSGTSAQTFNGTLRHFDLWYIPGTGAALMLNGVILGTIASGSLPTGVSASANGWAVLMEHTTATNGTSIVQQHPFIVDFLSE